MNTLLACVLAFLLAMPVVECQVEQEALRVLRRSGSLFWINRQRLNKFKPHRSSLRDRWCRIVPNIPCSVKFDASQEFENQNSGTLTASETTPAEHPKIEFGPMHDLAKAQYGREFQRKLEELEKMNLNNEI